MPLTSQEVFQKTWNSISGVDIKAVFHTKASSELQAFSYAIQREKAPVYTMGSPDPRAFSRGKRGIAGTLIFVMLDKHALVGGPGSTFENARFYADAEEVMPQVNTQTFSDPGYVAAGGSGVSVNDILGESSPNTGDNLDYDQVLQAPWYADQVPPFNVVLTGANEMGILLSMRGFGLEILNEGYGISIDDLQSEMQMTYVCRAITPWMRIPSNNYQNVTPG